MRDIIDKLAYLTESTGLAGRKVGDTFKNPEGKTLTFNEITFYPEQGGKYSPEELNNIEQQIQTQLGNITWLNAKNVRMGGFGIASFTDDQGNPVYIGQYLQNVKPTKTDNYVPNQFLNYKFAGKSAAKAQSNLTPQDLLTDKTDLTIPDIMNQLAKSLGTDNPLYAVAHKIAIGEGLPITFTAPTDVSFSAFRDYFCEILQPMALQKGLYTGNAGEAAETFLDGTFEDTLISFDQSKTAGLSDSILTNPMGKSVKISSKGGKGATASASNLVNSINELQQTNAGRKLLKKYNDVIDMLRDIQAAGQHNAPLMLGIKMNIIDQDDAKQVRQLKNTRPIDLNNLESMDISDNLKKLAKERPTNNPENTSLYYHLIAAIAHKAAEKVNDTTNFSKAAADILNNGALVQVYTKAKESKGNWTLENFDTVYPGESIKGVWLSAGKTYYSTDIKGNFTFKIDKGTGKPKEENSEVTPVKNAGATDLASDSEKIVNKISKPAERGMRQKRK